MQRVLLYVFFSLSLSFSLYYICIAAVVSSNSTYREAARCLPVMRYIYIHTLCYVYIHTCIYLYIYIHLYTCMYTCVYLYVYIHIYTCIHTYHIHIYVLIWTYIQLHICIYICMYTFTRKYTDKCIHTYAYINTCKHTYTYICVWHIHDIAYIWYNIYKFIRTHMNTNIIHTNTRTCIYTHTPWPSGVFLGTLGSWGHGSECPVATNYTYTCRHL